VCSNACVLLYLMAVMHVRMLSECIVKHDSMSVMCMDVE